MKRVLLGENAVGYNAGYGLWVSKPGKDITSTNMNDFLIAPGVNNTFGPFSEVVAVNTSLPLLSEGTAVRVAADSFGDFYLYQPCVWGVYWPHSLGFVPMVWSDIQQTPQQFTYYNGNSFGAANGQPYQNQFYMCTYADASKVGVEFHANIITGGSFGGHGINSPASTTFVLALAIHFAVMGVQVA